MSPIAGEWWRSGTVYQIYPRSFQDTDGDGNGDLKGILSRVDHLAWLGVDAVWITPFSPSPQVDSGYDVSDYCGVDTMYGTLEDFDDLVHALHGRSIRVVVDLVLNHTSDQHGWFSEARSSRESPKHDWYIWAEPRFEDGVRRPPTNWRSSFGGPAWTWNEPTGEYYLHLFDPSQPDLNWDNPEVREALHAVVRWWRDRGVDGFRLDVINHISKDRDEEGRLPDASPSPADLAMGDGLANGSAHYTRGPRLHEFLRELHDVARTSASPLGGQLLLVGEMPGADLSMARTATGPNNDELDMIFTFEHMRVDRPHGNKWLQAKLELLELKRWADRWQTGLHGVGWNALYWGNHDQPRVLSRWGNDHPARRVDSAMTLWTTLAFMQGTFYLYQGDEFGAANGHFTERSEFRDVASLFRIDEMVQQGHSHDEAVRVVGLAARDNARVPMAWNRTVSHGEFTSGEPWMGPGNDVWPPAEDAMRVASHLRRLVGLRREWNVVAEGDFELLAPQDPQLFAYRRRSGSEELVVLANWGSTNAPVPPDLLHLLDLQPAVVAGTVFGDGESELGPWASRVWWRTI